MVEMKNERDGGDEESETMRTMRGEQREQITRLKLSTRERICDREERGMSRGKDYGGTRCEGKEYCKLGKK
ncbi:hypothetical protein AMTR_s00074p00194110 [Amborella trichopoda]|uniref:Uncharacterized protein n=1 Tax=Amborella trichopoda TaxID=13333 RepID=W1NN55_AMBTC|nr:hypothetical protein AMTR_s00074p00194110 [Amborella trichopoda]